MSTNNVLSESDKKYLDSFLEYVSPKLAAYNKYSTASFIFIKNDRGELVLNKLIIFLNAVKSTIDIFKIKTKNIYAGSINLSGYNLEKIIKELSCGEAKIDEILFSTTENSNKASLYYSKFENIKSNDNRRIDKFFIRGSHIGYPYTPELDWELKSHDVPFHHLTELLNKLGIVGDLPGHKTVEIIASNVAVIDQESIIENKIAKIKFKLSNNLDRNKSKVGCIISKDRNIIDRKLFFGKDIMWGENDFTQNGSVEFGVEEGSIINSIVSYDGVAQNEYWVFDPTTSANPRRAIMQMLDDNDLSKIRSLLEGNYQKRARDFENAVSWLAWMIGFNTNAVGPVLTDNSDLYMTSPNGDILIVECTVGKIPSSKMAKLANRATQAKKKLEESGHNTIRVLPVAATSLTHDEILPDIEYTEKNGIHVLAREDLIELLINQTHFDYSAQDKFEDAYKDVQLKIKKHQPDPQPDQGTFFK